nr:proline-rich protein 36-like [Aegilops tauschii subsp. strangulata]
MPCAVATFSRVRAHAPATPCMPWGSPARAPRVVARYRLCLPPELHADRRCHRSDAGLLPLCPERPLPQCPPSQPLRLPLASPVAASGRALGRQRPTDAAPAQPDPHSPLALLSLPPLPNLDRGKPPIPSARCRRRSPRPLRRGPLAGTPSRLCANAPDAAELHHQPAGSRGLDPSLIHAAPQLHHRLNLAVGPVLSLAGLLPPPPTGLPPLRRLVSDFPFDPTASYHTAPVSLRLPSLLSSPRTHAHRATVALPRPRLGLTRVPRASCPAPSPRSAASVPTHRPPRACPGGPQPVLPASSPVTASASRRSSTPAVVATAPTPPCSLYAPSGHCRSAPLAATAPPAPGPVAASGRALGRRRPTDAAPAQASP